MAARAHLATVYATDSLPMLAQRACRSSHMPPLTCTDHVWAPGQHACWAAAACPPHIIGRAWSWRGAGAGGGCTLRSSVPDLIHKETSSITGVAITAGAPPVLGHKRPAACLLATIVAAASRSLRGTPAPRQLRLSAYAQAGNDTEDDLAQEVFSADCVRGVVAKVLTPLNVQILTDVGAMLAAASYVAPIGPQAVPQAAVWLVSQLPYGVPDPEAVTIAVTQVMAGLEAITLQCRVLPGAYSARRRLQPRPMPQVATVGNVVSDDDEYVSGSYDGCLMFEFLRGGMQVGDGRNGIRAARMQAQPPWLDRSELVRAAKRRHELPLMKLRATSMV